jgi:hypothetical protein
LHLKFSPQFAFYSIGLDLGLAELGIDGVASRPITSPFFLSDTFANGQGFDVTSSLELFDQHDALIEVRNPSCFWRSRSETLHPGFPFASAF